MIITTTSLLLVLRTLLHLTGQGLTVLPMALLQRSNATGLYKFKLCTPSFVSASLTQIFI
ncbi:hypothetical protein CS542_07740 [Pedobacter sp. IW39]|nr:hypothetical protein CS542_07740 [Pedobacter sp. IW39]